MGGFLKLINTKSVSEDTTRGWVQPSPCDSFVEVKMSHDTSPYCPKDLHNPTPDASVDLPPAAPLPRLPQPQSSSAVPQTLAKMSKSFVQTSSK
jgi:hypothetical protein